MTPARFVQLALIAPVAVPAAAGAGLFVSRELARGPAGPLLAVLVMWLFFAGPPYLLAVGFWLGRAGDRPIRFHRRQAWLAPPVFAALLWVWLVLWQLAVSGYALDVSATGAALAALPTLLVGSAYVLGVQLVWWLARVSGVVRPDPTA